MGTDLTSKLPIREHIRNMKKMLKYVQGIDKYYFPVMGIVQLLDVAIPYMELLLSAYILDGINTHKDMRQLFLLIAAAVLAVLLTQFAMSTLRNKMEVHRQQIFYLYECETQTKMLELDFSRIDSPEVKMLQERIWKDNNWGAGIYSVLGETNSALWHFFNLVGAVVIGLPAAGYLVQSREAAGWIVLALLVAVQVIGIRMHVYFRKMADVYRYHMAETEAEREEALPLAWRFASQDGFNYKNGKDIRIYGSYDLMERWTTEVYRHKAYRDKVLKGVKGDAGDGFVSAMSGGAINGASYLIVAIIALAGTITVGSVIRFAGCLVRLLDSATGLFHTLSGLALASRRQLTTLELISLQDEMYKGKLPVEKRSDNQYQIEFRNVSFQYPGTEQYVLKNFSMKLKIGEKLAIVGMNGSGKTTMIKLLCRLYDPQEGEILLNGVNIRKFKQDEYSRLFSVVFQDFVLYPFPLAQNVAVNQAYDAALVKQCLEDVDFGTRLSSLENGMDTYLYKDYEDSGIEISGGEAQKIAIARAIYKDAPFILLDEPTAALDPLAEYEIYTNFDKIIGTKTAIYISHRLSSCKFCEKIAVFHEGRLVQLGNHEELVADRDGKYYELWHAQAQYYSEGPQTA